MTLDTLNSYWIFPRSPMSKAFFEELAEQIRQNEALLALGDELRTQIPSIPRNLHRLINWFNDPNNRAAIQSVRVLNLSNKHLKILPDKLSLFTGIRSLNLSNNHLRSINLLSLRSLEIVDLSNNHLRSLNVTSLVNLRDLRLDDNQIERVPGLLDLGALKYLHLSNNHLRSINLLGLRSLEIVDLENNPLISVVEVSKPLGAQPTMLLSQNPLLKASKQNTF